MKQHITAIKQLILVTALIVLSVTGASATPTITGPVSLVVVYAENDWGDDYQTQRFTSCKASLTNMPGYQFRLNYSWEYNNFRLLDYHFSGSKFTFDTLEEATNTLKSWYVGIETRVAWKEMIRALRDAMRRDAEIENADPFDPSLFAKQNKLVNQGTDLIVRTSGKRYVDGNIVECAYEYNITNGEYNLGSYEPGSSEMIDEELQWLYTVVDNANLFEEAIATFSDGSLSNNDQAILADINNQFRALHIPKIVGAGSDAYKGRYIKLYNSARVYDTF